MLFFCLSLYRTIKNTKAMQDLFSTPISKRKVRNGIFAYKYQNGTVNINGEKFIGYSIKDSIKIWRSRN
jgi:hypothetical protein